MAERKGSAVTGNGFDPKQSKIWMDQLWALQVEAEADAAAQKGKNFDRAERKKDILEAAKNSGIPKDVLLDSFKMKVLEVKKERIRNRRGEDHAAEVDLLRKALGDFQDMPLGQAAIKAKGMPGADAPASIQ